VHGDTPSVIVQDEPFDRAGVFDNAREHSGGDRSGIRVYRISRPR
jgi:hypothetical protein